MLCRVVNKCTKSDNRDFIFFMKAVFFFLFLSAFDLDGIFWPILIFVRHECPCEVTPLTIIQSCSYSDMSDLFTNV